MIRGLKPTAKFCCRYATNMRLQPTTDDPRPRISDSWPRVFDPSLTRRAWERGRPARMGVLGIRPWVETHGKILLPLCGEHAIATHDQWPASTDFRPTSTGFQPTTTGIPTSASSRMGNHHTAGLEFRRRVATDEFSRGFQPTGSWVHPRWVSTHGSRHPTPHPVA